MNFSDKNSFEQPLADLLKVNLLFQKMNKTLEDKIGLSLVQWFLLWTLKSMPAIGPLGLARALGITQGSLTQSLRRLSGKNLILVCDDPKDARKKIISLTRVGKRVLDKSTVDFEFIFEDLKKLDGELSEIKNYLKTRATYISA
ncbi:MAG: MarR family winged helix-turn-helix transcriptional regulator [Bdellovibrionales bacterium]